MLVPYWADADTRPAGGGTVYYRETTNSTLLDRASMEIQNAFTSNFYPTHLFIATWDAVGFYPNRIDKVFSYMCHRFLNQGRAGRSARLVS